VYDYLAAIVVATTNFNQPGTALLWLPVMVSMFFARRVVHKWRHAPRGKLVHVIVTTYDVRAQGRVTSHTSDLWETTVDSQMHVAIGE